MNTARAVVASVLLAFTAGGQSLEAPDVLDLKNISAFSAKAMGKLLILNLTNQISEISVLAERRQTPLKQKQKGPSPNVTRIKVLFGTDIIGFARVVRVAMTDANTGVHPKVTKATTVRLMFDTDEQAVRAAQALAPQKNPAPLLLAPKQHP